MNHNRFSLPVDNKAAVELVDVPGSDRVRGQVILQIPKYKQLVNCFQVIDEFSGSARAVVFVVDSNTVSKQVRDVAEYLHFLLTNKNINSNRCCYWQHYFIQPLSLLLTLKVHSIVTFSLSFRLGGECFVGKSQRILLFC